MRIPKLDKEVKIYLVIVLIIYMFINFLPQISALLKDFKLW